MNSYAALNYKEHFVVTADLDTLLPAGSAKLAPADVQTAVAEALLAAEDGFSEGADPLDVRVRVDACWMDGWMDV